METTPERVLIEVAVQSAADAATAGAAGADRLELCAALEVGGLTPAVLRAQRIVASTRRPVVAMVRPRAGGFCYTEEEFELMVAEAAALRDAGASGIVVGMLREDGRVDAARCRAMRAACGGAELVFHRAFDLAPDSLAALDTLMEVGFTRILTSGGEPGVAPPSAGAERVAQLRERAAGQIAVLPGGGVRAGNVAALLRMTGCTEVHAGCTRVSVDPSAGRMHGTFGFGAGGEDGAYLCTDAAQVTALRQAVDEYARGA